MEVFEVKRPLHQPAYGSRPGSRTPTPPLSQPHDSYRPLTPSPPPRPRQPPSPPVPTAPKAPVAPEAPGPLSLMPCPVCGRTFLPESLVKHVKICEKMATKKRKTFDSSRQRREGTDLEQFLPKNFGLPENSPFVEKSPPPTAKVPAKKIHSVRSAIAKPTADLSKCPHCGRAFGLRAFERHVEWCADKAKILPAAAPGKGPVVTEAKHRLNARTQYKAPLRSRRSLTREKNSYSRSTSLESTGGRCVSPPPPPPAHPPKEYADRFRHRGSEGCSSEYYDDNNSQHVPVIRQNKRGSGADYAGDTIKARQARLAKDLNANKINDDYDPFLSAARQMKELMSSDTNIPKKMQSTPKDNVKTLPYLRNNKEKSPPFHARPDYSKTMNSINKNTPQLQRMKSFGSNNSDYNSVNTFGGRASSFRINRNNNDKSSPKLNTTFTKSSKENINVLDKSPFNRTSSLNKSFSSYTSSYSTNKKKEQPKIMSTSLNHSIQRTIKPVNKLEKIIKAPVKKEFINLDCILTDDNSSTADIQCIDPSLINANDNLPINVNTILNNPDMISSMESLLNTDNLPSKFETFKVHQTNNNEQKPETNDNSMHVSVETTTDDKTKSTNSTITTPSVDDLSLQYDKIMTSLEQSINSKISVRDDDSLCEDFDLEEFMTSFDEELNKQKSVNGKRSYSSTTRIVKSYDKSNSNLTSEFNSISSSPKININGNGLIPFNKSSSMTFSDNILTESVFPSSVKRSTSLLDTLPKKSTMQKMDTTQKKGFKSYKTEEACLEQEIMQSFKDFDKFYENEHVEDWISNKKDNRSHSRRRLSEKSEASKKESHTKEIKSKYEDEQITPNHTPIQVRESNGKMSNDSAYSSLNRISPSKLSMCNSKEMPTKMERGTTPPPHCSDSSGSHKEELRAMSSDEFLALERSTEAMDQPLDRPRSIDKEIESYKMDMEKRVSGGRRTPSWRSRADLSSSSSECSLPAPLPPPRAGEATCPPAPPPRLSRFCHECGSKFHIATAKFCTECGARRLNI